MPPLPESALKYILHHVFLPPLLPQAADSEEGYDRVLCEEVLAALEEYEGLVAGDDASTLRALGKMVHSIILSHHLSASGAIIEVEVQKLLSNVINEGGIVSLHVAAQNAGVLIWRNREAFCFECFEISPSNEAIFQTSGRLQRIFPSYSVTVDPNVSKDEMFIASISQTLARMSNQNVASRQPTVKKAGDTHNETRDTVHPGVVTELLFGYLTALGQSVNNQSIAKNSREEVLWRDTHLPWRRSPVWMFLRVSLQLGVARMAGAIDVPNTLYKHFMIFFMARIVDQSTSAGMHSDILHSMNAKLLRRLFKHGATMSGEVLNKVSNTMQLTERSISKRWADIQSHDKERVELQKLQAHSAAQDTLLFLPDLDKFVEKIAHRSWHHPSSSFAPSSDIAPYTLDVLPCLSLTGTDYRLKIQTLHRFENWIASSLSSWVDANQTADACCDLVTLSMQYHKSAGYHYTGNPEATSLMVLCLMELWVACDRIALSVCPLLSKYHPGVVSDPLQNLLLASHTQLLRLAAVESYLESRSRAPRSTACLFYHKKDKYGFGAAYFDSSLSMQEDHEAIIRQAEQDKSTKIQEFERLKLDYRHLYNQYIHTACEYREVVVRRRPWTVESRHMQSCSKCDYASRMDNLTIGVHEWPLPDDPIEAKTIVFELTAPSWFCHWRELTFNLRLDVFESEYSPTKDFRPHHQLASDVHLGWRYSGGRCWDERIILASEAKPNAGTHRKVKAISTASASNVCVRNGYRYAYFDSKDNVVVGQLKQQYGIVEKCTYRLPDRSRVLQAFIARPAERPDGPPPNAVIAQQHSCPDHMTLHEFKELASVSLGHHLQWANILAHLGAPGVDFRKAETTMIMLQCIRQAGPPSRTLESTRPGHMIAADHCFAQRLLTYLEEAFSRVQENWEHLDAVDVFTAIAARMTSSVSSIPIKHAYLKFLSKLRAVLLKWTLTLKSKAREANEKDREGLIGRCTEAALICSSTYRVEHADLRLVLGRLEAISTLLQCSIVIQEGQSYLHDQSGTRVALLKGQHYRLLHDALDILMEEDNTPAFDDAITRSWAGYQPGSGWKQTPTSSHWIATHSRGDQPQHGNPIVHLDLLSGTLLVNGLPLERLPLHYTSHAVYRRLFGKFTIEVMPSSVRGMQFSSKARYDGNKLEFGQDGDDFLLQASWATLNDSSNKTFNLVPSGVFRGKIPSWFVDKFVHWYHMETDIVEFRPLESLWKSRFDTNPKLTRISGSPKWKLVYPDGRLIMRINGRFSQPLATIFARLANPIDLHCIFSPASRDVIVDIPHLRLRFTLDRTRTSLQSRDFSGYTVDSNQSLGTLIGFENVLLLRKESSGERMALLLYGRVTTRKGSKTFSGNGIDGEHVSVMVDPSSATKVQPFRVDAKLGRLVDNGSLQSKLFLAYIHALTSYCRPDPLTKLTGSEQALEILRSAAVRSFDRLTRKDVTVLTLIANLSPSRAFYPRHERVMQTVEWSEDLSFLSQRSAFFCEVSHIFAQSRARAFLYPNDTVKLPVLEGRESHLLDRDQIRSSYLYVSGFGAEYFGTQHDSPYASRDRGQDSTWFSNVHSVSDRIFYSRPELSKATWTHGQIWDFLRQHMTVLPFNEDLVDSLIGYDGSSIDDRGGFLAQNFLKLQSLLKQQHRWNKFSVMIWLSAFACTSQLDMSVVEMVSSFFVKPKHFPSFQGPAQHRFDLSRGYRMDRGLLHATIRSYLRPLQECPESSMYPDEDEPHQDFIMRRDRKHVENQDSAIEKLASGLLAQWPTETPQSPNDVSKITPYINLAALMTSVSESFKTIKRNVDLRSHLRHLESAFRSLGVNSVPGPTQHTATPSIVPSSPTAGIIMSASSLFGSSPPPIQEPRSLIEITSDSVTEARQTQSLGQLVQTLHRHANKSLVECKYALNLATSATALQNFTQPRFTQLPSPDEVRRHLSACSKDLEDMEATFERAMVPASEEVIPSIAHRIQMWPRCRPCFLLKQLRSKAWQNLPANWKNYIVNYARSHVAFQQAQRVYLAMLRSNQGDLISELRNVGHENWDPFEHPEWLLLEVESNITIRSVQASIARSMIHPPEERNTSMQLNMGEGKSSVIVPMVSCARSNGSELVRVVVAKPQAKQMAQMLVAKLGGMLNRQVHYLPFSRDLKLDASSADHILSAFRKCMETRGVLLIQPEHILSFQLMALESYISGNEAEAVGKSLMSALDFFNTKTRDIIDESDENFSVKYELIYTMGTQRSIEMSPERWDYVHQILDFVHTIALMVEKDMPKSIEIHGRKSGAFPRVRVLDKMAEQALKSKIGRHICKVGLPGLAIGRQPTPIQEAFYEFITETDPSCDTAILFETFEAHEVRQLLLLLRGLLAHGVIGFVLSQKRWRINYGLDDSRKPPTRLAVPYRAKDMPSPRSEFSHPDVVMLLTCLSYYYEGLGEAQLHMSFQHLLDSDQKEMIYQEWVKSGLDLDKSFRQLDGINLKDQALCKARIFPAFRHSKPVVDYFLSHFVFPKEMREFPSKLSSSGWDLGRCKDHPTSAFSGTSDSQVLLPLDVHHLSLPEQEHTNALVLDYLLQPETGVVSVPAFKSSAAQELLDTIIALEPRPRVILDVGAQILELSNRDVAIKWLKLETSEKVRAVVYVNSQDELTVVDRNSFSEPLQSSPFQTQLDSCLIFLDEAHTRGIDLKLPQDYRAAVTLGANLTKDRLVQACMRMRKLGHGQTVVFCISPEIRRKIEAAAGLKENEEITACSVVQWTIKETCLDLQRSMPLWAVQGQRFVRQEKLWQDAREGKTTQLSQAVSEQFLEDEARSLEDRYGLPSQSSDVTSAVSCGQEGSKNQLIKARLQEYASSATHGSTLQEEQERELSPETEQERQIERPAPATPAEHNIHRDLIAFVRDGKIKSGSAAYKPAFSMFANSVTFTHFNAAQLDNGGELWATADYARTIKTLVRTDNLESFQRSVQWVLIRTSSDVVKLAMVISPFEAEHLFTNLWAAPSSPVSLHLYKPCWNLEHLALHRLGGLAIPTSTPPQRLSPSLAAKLNLFAGRLYFDSVKDYQDLCTYLGLATSAVIDDIKVAPNGFIMDASRRDGAWTGLVDNPLTFVHALLKIRRNGEDVSKTHMGKLVLGDLRLPNIVKQDVESRQKIVD